MGEPAYMAPTRFAALRCLLQAARGSAGAPAPPQQAARLQAYITHGILRVEEVLNLWNQCAGLTLNDRLCQTTLHAAFHQHVWRHRGEGIFQDIQKRGHALQYQSTIPADIRMAATGVVPVDQCIRQLYQSGFLTHSQMQWLAAYTIHLRKIDWRAGARWVYGHLLGGDLASLHLAWQKVAGTTGQAPMLFNAETMGLSSDGDAAAWLDYPLAEMLELANSPATLPCPALRPLPHREPPLLAHPPAKCIAQKTPLPALAGEDLCLLHPWSLGPRPQQSLAIGVLHLPFHMRFPWSEARWDFVLTRMQQVCDAIWIGDLNHCHQWLREARTVYSQATLNPGYREALDIAGAISLEPSGILPDPGYPCASFDSYLQHLRRACPNLLTAPLAGQIARLHRQEASATKKL